MDVRVGDWVRWDWDGDLARPVYARVRAIRYERRLRRGRWPKPPPAW